MSRSRRIIMMVTPIMAAATVTMMTMMMGRIWV